MAYAVCEFDATDEDGNLLTNVEVEVRRETGGLQVAYSDREGTISMGSTFLCADGHVRFYAPGNAYRITLTKGAYTRTLRHKAIGLAAESDMTLGDFEGDWDSETVYPQGAYTAHDGVGFFVSTGPENLNNEPDAATPASTEFWTYVPSESQALGNAAALLATAYAEEWAQSPDPISEAAGGDGATDQSSKTWAAKSQDWAEEDEDVEVKTGQYSALHHSAKAAAARDVAAGYASDAVSQGNVPIYATVVGMSAIEVPSGINSIFVNGYNAADDGGKAKYVDTDNGTTAAFTSGGSTARDWYLDETAVTLAMFDGVQADLDAYLAVVAADEDRKAISAPYILPTYRGLKISEFLTNNDPWTTPKTSDMQEAVEAMLSNTRYSGLDLEGRLLVIDDELNLGTNNVFFPQKSMSNGYIYANGDFPLGGYVFNAEDCPDWRNFNFTNMIFSGNARGGWFRMPQKYKGIRFIGCQFNNAAGAGDVLDGAPADKKFGFYDPEVPVGGSHELHISESFFDSGQSTTLSSDRDVVGIFSNNPDMILANNIGQYFETWLYGRSGSYQLLGNHIWSDADGTTANKMVHFTDATRALGAIFAGNYIDGVECRFSNEDNDTRRIGGFSFSGNLMLATPTVPEGFSFVVLEPHAADTGLTGVTMTGNIYDNNGSVVFTNIAADTTYGTIDADNIQRVSLDDVGADISRSGRVYRSKSRYNSSVAAAATKAFDTANFIPPFAKIKRAAAHFERASGGAAMAYAVPRVTGDFTATVDLSASSTGRIELEVDINSDNYSA